MIEDLAQTKDDLTEDYYRRRQIVHELNAPALEMLRRHGLLEPMLTGRDVNVKSGPGSTMSPENSPQPASAKDPSNQTEQLPQPAAWGLTREEIRAGKDRPPEAAKPLAPPEEAYLAEQQAMGRSPEEAAQDIQGLQEPWIDPVSAFAGGAGGMTVVGLNRGLSLAPTLGRALLSGTVSAGAEYPIGMAAEKVENRYPAMALPFTVLTGMVSGMTIENAIEQSVVRAFKAKAITPSMQLIKDSAARVRQSLESGQPEDELTAFVAKDIERLAAGDIAGRMQLSPASMQEGESLAEVDVKALDQAFSRNPELYVGQGGKGEIEGRLEDVGKFIETDQGIHAPQVRVDDQGNVVFADGRHRFAALRDMGIETLPVAMDAESLKYARRAGYLAGVDAPAVKFRKPTPVEFAAARNQSGQLHFMTAYDETQLNDFDLHLSDDNMVGYALTPEKDLVNVFNTGPKGRGIEAVIHAIENDAATLDCMGDHLRRYYEEFGFRVYQTEPWDDAYAPPGWDLTKDGTPDIYYMRYEGGSRDADTIIQSLPEGRRRRLEDLRRAAPGSQPGRSGPGRPSEVDPGTDRGEGRSLRSGEPDGPSPSGGLHLQPSDVEVPAQVQAQLTAILGDTTRPLSEILAETPGKAESLGSAVLFATPEKAVNINFSRIQTTDDVKELIAKVGLVYEPEIRQARRGGVSHEETQALADDLNLSVEQLLQRRRGQALNAHEALAARQLLVTSGEKLQRMARKINSASATDLDKFAFQKQLGIHYAIQAQVSGMTAEAGRALNAFRITAKAGKGQLDQINQFMRHLPKGVSTEEVAEKLAQMEAGIQVNAFIKQARKATTRDMLMEAWINGLLSGPQTHVVNSISNALYALWQAPERYLAAGFSKMLPGAQEIRVDEARAYAYGMVEGLKDGIKAFGRAVRTGEGSDTFEKVEGAGRRAITAENLKDTLLGKGITRMSSTALDEGGIFARAVDLIGEGVRMPGRFLTAEDDFFKSVGYRAELRARAFRQAQGEGLEGPAMARRMAEILAEPPDDIQLAAIDMARYTTFTKELGRTGRSGMAFVNRVPGARLIVPFLRTPTNIVKAWGERTPLALASKRIRADIAAGGARRDLALARISMGSMAMGVGATLAAEGYITGGGPADPDLRAIKRNTGWQPYSLRIGDKYYAYNRLEPVGMFFGIAADAAEIMGQVGEEDRQTLATAAVIAIAKNVTSKTWLKGVSEAVNTLEDPERNMKRFIQGYAKSIVPALAGQVARTLDPELKETYSNEGFFRETWNAILSRVPGYSQDVPARRNLWGEKVLLEGGWGPDMLSPIYTSTAKESPIDEELLRLRMRVGMPRKTQSFFTHNIPLAALEYDRYVVLMNTLPIEDGQTLKQSLDTLVTRNKTYRDASDERKELMIRQRINHAREMARKVLYRKTPDIRTIVQALQRMKIQGTMK